MKTLVPCDVCSFVAQSHTPCNCCVRFATTVASGHATLATKRTLLLTWAGLHFHRLDRTSFAWRTHSITSSARASSVGGTSRPSALAVLRLITNSNLVDCWTGRSDGFAPLRILSTKLAERYHVSLFGANSAYHGGDGRSLGKPELF